MEKRLVTTRADSNIEEMCSITHPILKRYADMCGADFTILNQDIQIHPHYRILELGKLLDVYDRILIIDSDVLLLWSCPNIFELVYTDHIGTIFEDVGSRQEHRRGLIKKIQEERGDVGWESGYLNTGFFLCSKEHKVMFDTIQLDNLWTDFGQDDVELGYQIHKHDLKIYELPFMFNHMSLFSEAWNNWASRFHSFCIHYAGNSFYGWIPRLEQIKRDYFILKKYGMLL